MRRWFSVSVVVMLIVAACGTAASPAPSGPTTTPGASPAPSAAPSVATSAAPTTAASAAPSTAASAAPSAAPSAAGSPAASAGGGTVAGTVLRASRLADWYNFCHPVQFQTGNQFQQWSLLFNTLIKVDVSSRTIVPDLADSWEASPDATEFTFHLHPGVTWHDGTPFTADDVVYTITWGAQNYPSYKGFLPQWNRVQGAADVLNTTNPLPGVEKIDDLTVKLTLEAPNADFLVGLADMAHAIMPEHLLKDLTAADAEKVDFTLCTPGATIGTGPYTLASYAGDQQAEFVANPNYFKGAPAIERVIYKFFADTSLAIAQLESGDLDLAFRVPPGEFDRLSTVSSLNVISAPNPGVITMNILTDVAPGDNVKFRQALYYAINRQAIADSYFKGRAKVLINPPGFKEYDDLNRYEYNPDMARQLLTEINYDVNTPFRILYNQTFPDLPQLLPLIQADLQAVGVNAELMPTESQAFLDIFNKREGFEASVGVGGSEALRPGITRQYFKPLAEGGDKYNSGYTNPRIFELWDAGAATSVESERDVAYHELAQILNTDVPNLVMLSPDLVMAATTRLGGTFDIHLNERETFMDVEGWTIQ